MRQLTALEPDVEEKAAYVLVMGGNAEKQGDFTAAVGFCREALAMEPMRQDVWYFIHNNLGYSLNMLGRFAEAEHFCGAAVEIDPARPNAHKNLGLALQGQNRWIEAATCFVWATNACPSDDRASQLLRRLVTDHRELEFEWGPKADRCEAAVRFAQWAIQRALSGKILRVVLACNDPILDELIAVPLGRVTSGAVEIVTAGSWLEILQAVGPGICDMVFVMPQNLRGAKWRGIGRWLRAINLRGSKTLVISGAADDLNEHGEACRQAGADDFMELPFQMDEMEYRLREFLARGNGLEFEKGTSEL